MSQKTARTCLITTTIIFGLGGLLGIVPAITSVFLFDAPGSEKNLATILLFCAAVTAPVVCVLSIALSWILYACKRFKPACWLSFLPTINLLCGAAALICLEVFNRGRLS